MKIELLAGPISRHPSIENSPDGLLSIEIEFPMLVTLTILVLSSQYQQAVRSTLSSSIVHSHSNVGDRGFMAWSQVLFPVMLHNRDLPKLSLALSFISYIYIFQEYGRNSSLLIDLGESNDRAISCPRRRLTSDAWSDTLALALCVGALQELATWIWELSRLERGSAHGILFPLIHSW